MDHFVGRRKELDLLESSFGTPCAFLMYGRRRVGKSTLLKRFCQGKRNIYINCIRGPEDINLRYLADVISNFTGTEHDRYVDYYEAFRDLERICSEETIVLVIDEFQYISSVSPEVKSYAQHLIDNSLDHKGSMVILCGSSVRMMRSLGEDGSDPLFGRFRRMIDLGPLSFGECRMLHPGMSDIDCMRLYLTVGGVPRYHVEIVQDTYGDCIRKNFLSDGWMTDETENLIMSEFSPGQRYLATLSAISNGSVRLKEIAERIGVEESTCSEYIRELEKAGIVSSVNPMKGAPKRRTYYVSDDMIAFNYEVLVRRSALIGSDRTDEVLARLTPYIDTFLGRRFELFCMRFIIGNYPVTEIGRWWRDDPRRNVHEDIDIVARMISGNVRTDLYIECKFTKEKVGFHVYNILDSRVSQYMDGGNHRLGFMSVSGFEDDFAEFARDAGILLIGPEELFGHRPVPEI